MGAITKTKSFGASDGARKVRKLIVPYLLALVLTFYKYDYAWASSVGLDYDKLIEYSKSLALLNSGSIWKIVKIQDNKNVTIKNRATTRTTKPYN